MPSPRCWAPPGGSGSWGSSTGLRGQELSPPRAVGLGAWGDVCPPPPKADSGSLELGAWVRSWRGPGVLPSPMGCTAGSAPPSPTSYTPHPTPHIPNPAPKPAPMPPTPTEAGGEALRALELPIVKFALRRGFCPSPPAESPPRSLAPSCSHQHPPRAGSAPGCGGGSGQPNPSWEGILGFPW